MRELSRYMAVRAIQPDPFNPPVGEHHITSIDDYLRAEQRDRTEPASFYVPGALGWSQWSRRPRQPIREDIPDEDGEASEAFLFDDPEALYDLTEGGYATSDLHPLED